MDENKKNFNHTGLNSYQRERAARNGHYVSHEPDERDTDLSRENIKSMAN